MEQRGPFRFLSLEEFNKLNQAEKSIYINGATQELMRRGEELRKLTRLETRKSQRMKDGQ
jgi:hypothetical protein